MCPYVWLFYRKIFEMADTFHGVIMAVIILDK